MHRRNGGMTQQVHASCVDKYFPPALPTPVAAMAAPNSGSAIEVTIPEKTKNQIYGIFDCIEKLDKQQAILLSTVAMLEKKVSDLIMVLS